MAFLRWNMQSIIICRFHIRSVHLHIITVFYPPTDAQVNCFKNKFKIYIKININPYLANVENMVSS
jgi:hypothetical protein